MNIRDKYLAQKRLGGLFLILGLWLAMGFAQAIMTPAQSDKLYIEITGGQVSGLPIAVVPFSVLPTARQYQTQANVLSQIIRQNLQNSGQFQPLSERALVSVMPKSAYTESIGAWKNLGAEYLVLGQLAPTERAELADTGSENFNIQYRLVNLYGSTGQSNILELKYENIPVTALRNLAHQISDDIFEAILGVKGFFSTRLAYVVSDPAQNLNRLCVSDADGENSRVLFSSKEPIMSPAWSPDGQQLAFVSFDNNRSGIHVLNLKTGVRKIAARYPGVNSAPTWSPNGEKIAFSLSKSGNTKIYLKNLKTNQLDQVTFGLSIDTEPTFSPDGQSIVFTSNRGGQPQIYQIKLSNRTIERLTFEGIYNASPALTPDGQYLVMMHQTSLGYFTIATQNLKNKKVNKLTQSKNDETPSLAPNGMMVIYGTTEANRGVLAAVSLDGRFKMRLPVPEGNVKFPAWSPFIT